MEKNIIVALIIGIFAIGIVLGILILNPEKEEIQNKELTKESEEIQKNNFSLTIDVEGDGVTYPYKGVHEYEFKEVVEINAQPDSGWKFSHWSGECEGEYSTCIIGMREDKYLTAHFIEE